MVEEILRTSLFALLFSLHGAAVGLAACTAATLASQAEDEVARSGTLFSIALALGFVIDLVLASALAFLGVLTPVVVVISALLTGGWAVVLVVRRHRRPWAFQVPKPQLLLLVLLFITTLARAFSVPGQAFDDTSYHLPVARVIETHHGLVVAPFLRFPLFPHAMEVMFAVGIMSAGVPGAQFVASLPLVIVFLGLLSISGLLFGSPAQGLLAILGIASFSWVRGQVGFAMVDLALGMCCSYALVGVLLADRTGFRCWLVLAGIFTGAACAVKYFGLPFAALISLYIGVRRRSLFDVLVFGAAALMVGGAWYARNWTLSGDPFHPVLGNLFGHYLWDAGDLASQAATLQSIEGGGSGTLALILRKKGLALVLVLLVALVTALTRRRRPDLFGLGLVVLAYCVFWLVTVRVSRYLLPALPAAGLMIGAGAAYWWRRALHVSPLRLAAGAGDRVLRTGTLAVAALAAILAMNQARLNFDRRDERLAAQPGHDAFALASQLRPEFGNRLVHLGFVNAIYFFSGEAIGDWFGPGRYRQMLDCPTPSTPASRCAVIDPVRMRRQLDRFGASMLVMDSNQFHFDETAYARDFAVVYRGRDGAVLMTPKPSASPPAALSGMDAPPRSR